MARTHTARFYYGAGHDRYHEGDHPTREAAEAYARHLLDHTERSYHPSVPREQLLPSIILIDGRRFWTFAEGFVTED